jgi:hypothetical protein
MFAWDFATKAQIKWGGGEHKGLTWCVMFVQLQEYLHFYTVILSSEKR